MTATFNNHLCDDIDAQVESLEELIRDFHGLSSRQRKSIHNEKLQMTEALLRSFRRIAQISPTHAAVELGLDSDAIELLSNADDESLRLLARQSGDSLGLSLSPALVFSIVKQGEPLAQAG
jgi:hypothetical protein